MESWEINYNRKRKKNLLFWWGTTIIGLVVIIAMCNTINKMYPAPNEEPNPFLVRAKSSGGNTNSGARNNTKNNSGKKR